MKKLSIIDCTLSKIETEDNSLLLREKVAAASILDSCGADMIEMPVMKKTREDGVIFKTVISSLGKSSVLFTVNSPAALENAADLISQTSGANVQIALPVSTVQMEYIFHFKEDRMTALISDLVKNTVSLGARVLFTAVDFTRADAKFLVKACNTAVENGAYAVMLSDTAGIAFPEDISIIVSEVKNAIDVPVFIDVSNKLHLGVACALSAIRAGIDGVRCSSVGDDILNAVDFADLICEKGNALGVSTNLDYTKIRKDITGLIRSVQNDVSEEKDISGKSDIMLDPTSSLSDVAKAVEKLGYSLSDEDIGKVHSAIGTITDKKGTIGATELEALIASYAMQAVSTYHLVGFNANCSNMTLSMAHIVLSRGDEKLDGVAAGDGPIDASFRAIEQIIGYHYELDDFQIRAVTEGREALGEALVRLRNGGKLYSGVGISTDIVGSSIRAYVNALNKIVAEENNG